MKIALASTKQKNRDIEYNLSQMESYMKAAKEEGAQLVCFGEAFLQGFDCLDWDYEKDRCMAVSTESDTFMRICQMSKTLEIDVLFGFIELSGDVIYSSVALISGGRLHHLYRRISQGWKEYWRTDQHYREGDAVSVFEYSGKRFAITLCGDLWDYPERFSLGEDVLIWPVYVSYSPEDWEKEMKEDYTRQAMAGCGHTLMINSAAEGDAYGGAFYFADGAIEKELPLGEEGLLVVEV